MYFSGGRLAGQERVCFVICPWLSRERGDGGGDRISTITASFDPKAVQLALLWGYCVTTVQ